ncbi:MAG: T9SS type A sorting domain-containing protein [Chitinophagales bacterium]
MIKIFFLFFFLMVTLRITAQTYTVPGAQIQPAWVFPLWFENADGQKDTLYFCYDSTANYPYPDTLFGVKLVHDDPSVFNMTFDALPFNDTSHLKVVALTEDVLSSGVSLFSQNVILPLILRWDPSVFYSDSLPYPDEDPAPRAEGHLWFDLPTFVDSCSYSVPILMTDTSSPFAYCHKADSIVFNGQYLSYLVFSVHPWKGIILNVTYAAKEEEIKVYPNPFKDNLILEMGNTFLGKLQFQIFDLNGHRTVEQAVKTSTSQIDVSSLLPGIYCWLLSGENKIIAKDKFVKV